MILCTGNTCRSQMVEGYLKHLDDSLQVFSAGINPGNGVNPYAVKVMREKGIDISGKLSIDVLEFQNESFDYLITVCDHAKEVCPVFNGEIKHQIHFGFEDPAETIGTDEVIIKKYREVRDLIIEKFHTWYNSIFEV